jgi:Immunity protein 35
MTRDEALVVAKRYVNDASDETSEFVVMEDETLTTEFGWVFFYNTRAYVERGDALAMAVGNAPLLIDKNTGELHVTGTALPIEHYIEAYRLHGTCHPDRT